MISVFVDSRHERLIYTLEYVFEERLGLDHELVSDRKQANFVYASDGHIEPSLILFSNDIPAALPSIDLWEGKPALFPTNGEIPFDLFAAIFWMLARVEEYNIENRDQMGRVSASSSFASKHNFLEFPIVDFWVSKFGEWLEAKLGVQCQKDSFEVCPTVDVDSAYAFKGKGLYRTVGGFGKDLLKAEIANAAARAKTLSGKQEDPYDTYAALERIHDQLGVKAKYFFLMGDFGKYDKGLPYDSNELKSLVESLKKKVSIALHPSVASNNDTKRLKEEKTRLEALAGSSILDSRFHYLLLTLPHSYRQLLEVGIEADYTMGYHDHIGFRAGTSRPYFWFDLEREAKTRLRIHPFCVMEATLKNYMDVSPQQSIERIMGLIKSCKMVNGRFTSLWHNESLSDYGEWDGWGDLYQKFWDRFLEEATD